MGIKNEEPQLVVENSKHSKLKKHWWKVGIAVIVILGIIFVGMPLIQSKKSTPELSYAKIQKDSTARIDQHNTVLRDSTIAAQAYELKRLEAEKQKRADSTLQAQKKAELTQKEYREQLKRNEASARKIASSRGSAKRIPPILSLGAIIFCIAGLCFGFANATSKKDDSPNLLKSRNKNRVISYGMLGIGIGFLMYAGILLWKNNEMLRESKIVIQKIPIPPDPSFVQWKIDSMAASSQRVMTVSDPTIVRQKDSLLSVIAQLQQQVQQLAIPRTVIDQSLSPQVQPPNQIVVKNGKKYAKKSKAVVRYSIPLIYPEKGGRNGFPPGSIQGNGYN